MERRGIRHLKARVEQKCCISKGRGRKLNSGVYNWRSLQRKLQGYLKKKQGGQLQE